MSEENAAIAYVIIRIECVAASMESEGRIAIILGGGEKQELRSANARGANAKGIPKQFSRLFGESTLLEQTHRRVGLAFSSGQILTIVTRAHRRFYEPVLKDVLPGRLMVQPRNRGTAPAVLYALLRLEKTAPDAAVAIFPSDHHIEDDAAFMRYVDFAFAGIRARPDLLVVLGATPDHPEVNCCWIEMGDRIAEYLRLFRIRALWEKPSRRIATRLWQMGCLWNSSVFVGQLSVLLLMMSRVFPQLTAAFDRLHSAIGEANESEVAEVIYGALSEQDFSHEIAVKCPESLAVLPVAGVEWSDP